MLFRSIFDVTTGELLHTLDNPNAFSTSAGDQFGISVAISGNYAIVGAYFEDDAGGNVSGKAYIFNVTTGELLHTLDNPNAFSTSAVDQFGSSVAVSGNYVIVSARHEDDAGGFSSGKAYIFNVIGEESGGDEGTGEESTYIIPDIDFTSSLPINKVYITADITRYLPRYDRVFLDYQGNFGVIAGNHESYPNLPENSMGLYDLLVKPYTKDANEVEVNYVDNKRYTMRDIGRIEKRVSNLEYYSVLNTLEKKTIEQQVIDPITGNNRFKNGFFADSFTDFSIGDASSKDFDCTFDVTNGYLRPNFETNGIDFILSSGTLPSNLRAHSTGLLTLNYTEKVLVSQSIATNYINVNPYAIYTWNGEVILSPSADFWKDTVYAPPKIVLNGGNENISTDTWRNWATEWAGVKQVSSSTTSTNFDDGFSSGVITTTETISIENSIVDNKMLSIRSVPFIRPRSVSFTAKGMKPITRLWPTFDGVDVSNNCVNSTGSSQLITNAAGEISGTFNIPASKFLTGKRTFRLTDNISTPDNELTSAETVYTASGAIETRQRTIVSTMTTQTSSRREVTWADPVAQSFLITDKGGCFLTSVTLYFKQKDANIPITLDLREMENGIPTGVIIPYSKVTLSSGEVNVSDDSTSPTVFTFSSPVYLQQNSEYCFVVSSNSNRYLIWIATMGEKQVNADYWVSKQPYVGVMFKSQNASTWTEDQNSDIKFVVKRADFVTSPSTVTFVNQTIPAQPLSNNPFKIVNTNTVQVNHKNHGMHIGSKVEISGSLGTGTITPSMMNKVHTVTTVLNNDVYTINVATANNPAVFGGVNVMATKNYQYTTIRPIMREMCVTGTNISWAIDAYTGKSLNGFESPRILKQNISVINDSENYSKVPLSVYNRDEEISLLSSNKSLKIQGTLNTSVNHLSPVIDMNQIGAMLIRNRINYPSILSENTYSNDEIEQTKKTFSRYINRTVSLNDPALTLKVWFDVIKPLNGDVLVYYRVVNADSGLTDINKYDWVEMNKVRYAPPGGSLYREEEYEINLSSTPFILFQVKLVMVSKNESEVPAIKNLRALAIS